MKARWNRFLHWRGWDWIFPLPPWAEAALFAGCCAGLVWVFLNGLAMWWPAYLLYGLSAYSLTALCTNLPAAIRRGKRWADGNPGVQAFRSGKERRFKRRLYRGQFINFTYGTYKIAAGVILGSAWIGCDGIYNMTQAMIQLYQILGRRRADTPLKQWRSYHRCGGLMLLLHLTLTGIVFQTVNWNRAADRGEIIVITTAVFAFYKLIRSIVNIVKDRAHLHPVDSSVRMLELAQAIFAVYSLQAGLLHTFGTGESWEQSLNLVIGSLVCLMTASMGVYMIHRGSREIKRLQEKSHA